MTKEYTISTTDNGFPTISLSGNGRVVADFLSFGADHPDRIERLMRCLVNVMQGTSSREKVETDYRVLEIDGVTSTVRATTESPISDDVETGTMDLQAFHEMASDWRSFVVRKWQEAPWSGPTRRRT